MTREDLSAVVRALVPVLRESMLAALATHTETLQQTATRVAALETDRLILADLPALRDRVTRLEVSAVAATDGLTVLGQVRERVAAVEACSLQGPPGPPGPPGVGLDDYDCTFDGERTVTLTLKSAAGPKAIDLVFPVPIYREVYRPGETYGAGDMVTWEGSTWVCRETTTSKPGDTDKRWRLAVKRGRDGRDK